MMKGIKISQMPMAEYIADNAIVMITQEGQNEGTTIKDLADKILRGNNFDKLSKIVASQANEIYRLKDEVEQLTAVMKKCVKEIERLRDKIVEKDLDSISCGCDDYDYDCGCDW